jgi:hypothetical protein
MRLVIPKVKLDLALRHLHGMGSWTSAAHLPNTGIHKHTLSDLGQENAERTPASPSYFGIAIGFAKRRAEASHRTFARATIGLLNPFARHPIA